MFNAQYLAYIDHTITELWRAAYGGYQVMLDRGFDMVVAEARLRFRGSARFDEQLALEATVTRLGTTAITTVHRHRRLDGELLVEADVRHVVVDPATGTKTPMPDWLRAGLEPWHIPAQPASTDGAAG